MSSKLKTLLFILLIALVSVSSVFAEDEIKQSAIYQEAFYSPDYLVTPGDIYTLAYSALGASVRYTIVVDPTYKVRVSNLGVIDAEGLSFLEFKKEVEDIVSSNYPMSGVQLILSVPATYKVIIKGEVASATEKKLIGLVRLSEVVAPYLIQLEEETDEKADVKTDAKSDVKTVETVKKPEVVSLGTKYTSSRFITVEDAKGKITRYDLFLAKRFGDMSQDPYVRPNDIITIEKAGRRVKIEGAVERPGTYELTASENLRRLVEYYAGGLDPLADTSHITLTRNVSDSAKSGEVLYLNDTCISDDYKLVNLDSVSIGSVKDLKNTIFVNGAVSVQISETLTGEVATRNIRYQFETGESYLDFIRNHTSWFTDVADFERSYLFRKGQRIPIDIYSMLFNQDYSDDSLKLEAEDTLVIPFKQYFVTVSGAVVKPGRYAYVPDRTWDYYIGLAGGFDQDRNKKDTIDIKTSDGHVLTKDDYIVPETIIDAKSNSFLYGFNKYATPLLTVLSILTSSLSLYMYFSNL